MQNTIDARYVIKQFGSALQVKRQLEQHLGITDLSQKAIEKWYERGSIPLKWYVQLERLAEIQGFSLKRNADVADAADGRSASSRKGASHKQSKFLLKQLASGECYLEFARMVSFSQATKILSILENEQ